MSRSVSSKRRNETQFAILLVLAAAFGLRVWSLGSQSLWGDEAISLGRALGSLTEIAQDARHEGTLPPGYYYVLHFFIGVAGTTETSLRFPAALAGTAAIAALYAAVKRTSPRAALIAALFAAISPFWLYYAQETRMYAQSTLLATASTALFLRLAAPGAHGKGKWALYILVSAMAVLTHYFAGFVLLAQNLIMGADLAAALLPRKAGETRDSGTATTGKRFRAWCVSQIAILMLLLPWVVYARDSLGVTAGAVNRAAISLQDIVHNLAVTFTVGASSEPEPAAGAVVLFAALIACALILRPREAWTWAALLVVPVAVTYLISFTPQPGWARYFIAASPAWFALGALGLDALFDAPQSISPSRLRGFNRLQLLLTALRRVVTLVVAAVIVGCAAQSASNYLTIPAYGRPNWRGAVEQITSDAPEGGAVVVNGPTWVASFDYYFSGTMARYDLPRPMVTDRAAIERELAAAAAKHSGVWLVKYYPPDADPDGVVEHWLADHAYRTSGRWVENATFSYYSLPQPPGSTPAPVQATFGSTIRLQSVSVKRVSSGQGDILQVTMQWEALAEPAADYAVFVHAVDGAGGLVAQHDSSPVEGYRPTRGWTTGETVIHRVGIRLPTARTSEPLTLRIGLYAPRDGRRLAVNSADGAAAGDFVAIPAP